MTERNAITDIFEAPSVGGLAFTHFALSRSAAPASVILNGSRRASLLYMSSTRGGYCTISGQVTILADPESRRRYWKSIWSASFPHALEAKKPDTAVLEEPWMCDDYLLLRLAIDEVALYAMVDGPQRWEVRKINRVEGTDMREEGVKWRLAS